jgi:hypothetical protein
MSIVQALTTIPIPNEKCMHGRCSCSWAIAYGEAPGGGTGEVGPTSGLVAAHAYYSEDSDLAGVSQQPRIEPRFLRSPADFEAAAADWMRAWGFCRVRVTRAGRDGGIDVESDEAVAQVKAWMVPIGSPAIQQLKGAAHDGRTPIFFSLMEYTPSAVQFADQAGVALFRFSGYSGEIEPVNASASELPARSWGGPRQLPDGLETRRDTVYELVSYSLRQAIGRGGWLGCWAILEVEGIDNRYVQIYACSEAQRGPKQGHPELHVESVGAELAAPPLQSWQLLRLAQLGWPPAKPGENYAIDYTGPTFPLEEITELLTRTLIEVHGVQKAEDIHAKIG